MNAQLQRSVNATSTSRRLRIPSSFQQCQKAALRPPYNGAALGDEHPNPEAREPAKQPI